MKTSVRVASPASVVDGSSEGIVSMPSAVALAWPSMAWTSIGKGILDQDSESEHGRLAWLERLHVDEDRILVHECAAVCLHATADDGAVRRRFGFEAHRRGAGIAHALELDAVEDLVAW